jgi:hypothetical protein
MMSRDRYIELKHTRGQKPVHLVADMPVPQGRQRIWQAIRALRKFSYLDLQAATLNSEPVIQTYLLGLTNAGYLKCERSSKTAKGQYGKRRWELVRDVGVEAPRVTARGEPVTQGAARQAMWQTMRILRRFSVRELVAAGTSERVQLKLIDARDYVSHLQRAGYLKNEGGRGVEGRYTLVPTRYSGPRAPQVQRIKQVFDPNLNKVVWPVKKAAA